MLVVVINVSMVNYLSVLCRPDNPEGDKVIRYTCHVLISLNRTVTFTITQVTNCTRKVWFYFLSICSMFHQTTDYLNQGCELCHLPLHSIPKDISALNLTVEKAPRQDIIFMKKVCVFSGAKSGFT